MAHSARARFDGDLEAFASLAEPFAFSRSLFLYDTSPIVSKARTDLPKINRHKELLKVIFEA